MVKSSEPVGFKDNHLIQWVYGNLNIKISKNNENYERMISGMLFDPRDDELQASQFTVNELTSEYGRLRVRDFETLGHLRIQREELVHEFLGKVGARCVIDPPVYFDFGYNTSIGSNFRSEPGLLILDCAIVTIGDNVRFGPNVVITTAGHPLQKVPRRTAMFSRSVDIGDNVTLGANVTVLPGICIGIRAVVRDGAVVSRDVPAGGVVEGVPARSV